MSSRHEPAFPQGTTTINAPAGHWSNTPYQPPQNEGLTKLEYAAIHLKAGLGCFSATAVDEANKLFDALEREVQE
jgi:hypothetical protein